MMELISFGGIYKVNIDLVFSRYENMIRLKTLIDLYNEQFSGMRN